MSQSTAEEPDPRTRFFNEEGESLPPFHPPGWRGCVLDRDRFDHTRLPRFLFEAIITATATAELLLRPYTPDRAESVALPPTWPAFREFVYEPSNWSLEYVLYDSSGQWAVLADPDIVIVGAEAKVADRIEMALAEHGTNLKRLTLSDFPNLDPVEPNWQYFAAVVGLPIHPDAP